MSPRPEGERYHTQGTKGTIRKFFHRFCRDHKLPKQLLEDVATIAVKGVHQILTNHLYPQPQFKR